MSEVDKFLDGYGKTNVAGFLVGQCMKASRGQGNPGVLREMLLSAIEKL